MEVVGIDVVSPGTVVAVVSVVVGVGATASSATAGRSTRPPDSSVKR